MGVHIRGHGPIISFLEQVPGITLNFVPVHARKTSYITQKPHPRCDEIGQFLPEPLYLRRLGLSGKAQDSHERCIYLAYPVIVNTADMITAVEHDQGIDETELTFQRHVKNVSGKGAVDATEVRV